MDGLAIILSEIPVDRLLGIAGLAVGLVSVVITIVITSRSRREKNLQWQVFPSELLVGTTTASAVTSNITIGYRRSDGKIDYVPQVYSTRVGFVNMGRSPITRADLIDTLRLVSVASTTLDVVISRTIRTESAIRIVNANLQDSLVVELDFKVLDHRDGALLQILSTKPINDISLRGTIVGMPFGPKVWSEPKTRQRLRMIGKYSFIAVILMIIFLAPLSIFAAISKYIHRPIFEGVFDLFDLVFKYAFIPLTMLTFLSTIGDVLNIQKASRLPLSAKDVRESNGRPS